MPEHICCPRSSISAVHPGGALAQLQMIHMLISDRIVGGSPCQVVYVPSVNLMNLIKSAARIVRRMGRSRQRARGQQPLHVIGSSHGTEHFGPGPHGDHYDPISFTEATFAASKNIYVNAFDNGGLLSHWVQGGVWTVQ